MAKSARSYFKRVNPSTCAGSVTTMAVATNFYTKEKAIQSPDDLKGVKIRVQNNATAIAMVKAMGGSPTPSPGASSTRP